MLGININLYINLLMTRRDRICKVIMLLIMNNSHLLSINPLLFNLKDTLKVTLGKVREKLEVLSHHRTKWSIKIIIRITLKFLSKSKLSNSNNNKANPSSRMNKYKQIYSKKKTTVQNKIRTQINFKNNIKTKPL